MFTYGLIILLVKAVFHFLKSQLKWLKNGHISIMLLIPGRPSKRGYCFQNSLASMNYGQIAQYFDIPRKIGWILFLKNSSKPGQSGA